MMDIRPKHQLLFPHLPVVRFEPHIGSIGFGSVYSFALTAKQIVLSVHIVETAYRNGALFQFKPFLSLDKSGNTGRILQGIREGTAMPQQLRVVVLRMANGQIRKETGLFCPR